MTEQIFITLESYSNTLLLQITKMNSVHFLRSMLVLLIKTQFFFQWVFVVVVMSTQMS